MHKKGMTLWEVIVWAVILLVVAVLLIYIFRNLLGAQADDLDNRIDSTGDSDGDLIPNAFDKCSNTKGGADVDPRGCAYNQKPDEACPTGSCVEKGNCHRFGTVNTALQCPTGKECCT